MKQFTTSEATFVCLELKSVIPFQLLYLEVLICSVFVCSYHGNHGMTAVKNGTR